MPTEKEHPKANPPKINMQYILIVLLIVAAYLIGSYKTKSECLSQNNGQPSAQVANNQNAPSQPPAAAAPSADKVAKISDSDWVRYAKGAKKDDAQVVLIEYSDFQCPYCRRFYPTVEQVMKDYNGKVAFVYRDFPLEQIHPLAKPLAEAAQCAGIVGGQDAYWNMHDKIFEGDEAPPVSDIAKLASSIGLDASKIQNCIDSKQGAKKVEANAQSGAAAGINGTPGTWVINLKTWKGQLVPGALPVDSLKQTIDTVLKG